LVIGGRRPQGRPIDTAEIFDPVTEAFVTVPMAGGVARSGHSATLLSDGRVLVAGGRGADGVVRDIELWDLDAGRVSSIGRLPRARADQIATLLADGRVALSGGTDAGGQPVADSLIVDPGSGAVVDAA